MAHWTNDGKQIVLTGESVIGFSRGAITKLTAVMKKLAGKDAQVLKTKIVTKKFKAKKLKKKARKIKLASVLKVSGNKGKVTYTVKPANKKSKKVLSYKKGKIKVKKKAKKGTYTLKVTIKAAGTSDYNAASKTVKVKVKVK